MPAIVRGASAKDEEQFLCSLCRRAAAGVMRRGYRERTVCSFDSLPWATLTDRVTFAYRTALILDSWCATRKRRIEQRSRSAVSCLIADPRDGPVPRWMSAGGKRRLQWRLATTGLWGYLNEHSDGAPFARWAGYSATHRPDACAVQNGPIRNRLPRLRMSHSALERLADDPGARCQPQGAAALRKAMPRHRTPKPFGVRRLVAAFLPCGPSRVPILYRDRHEPMHDQALTGRWTTIFVRMPAALCSGSSFIRTTCCSTDARSSTCSPAIKPVSVPSVGRAWT
jgi:hypothetical protein